MLDPKSVDFKWALDHADSAVVGNLQQMGAAGGRSNVNKLSGNPPSDYSNWPCAACGP